MAKPTSKPAPAPSPAATTAPTSSSSPDEPGPVHVATPPASGASRAAAKKGSATPKGETPSGRAFKADGGVGSEDPGEGRARSRTGKGGSKGSPTVSEDTASRAPDRLSQPVADKWMATQQELLLAERTRLTHQAETLKAEADQLAEDMEPGDVQFDEESGEGGTINVERERDLALSAQARAEIEEIDRALTKIVEGRYGVCEGCGQPIAHARLEALPQAALCVPCKSGGLLRR